METGPEKVGLSLRGGMSVVMNIQSIGLHHHFLNGINAVGVVYF